MLLKSGLHDENSTYGESSHVVLIMCSILSVKHLKFPKGDTIDSLQSKATYGLEDNNYVSG
jgi:hypothetical protein